MNRKHFGQTFLYGLVSLGFFLVILYFGLGRRYRYDDRQTDGSYDMVVFGDSQMGLVRDETSVPVKLAEMTGVRIYNAALGGTCLGYVEEDRILEYTKGSYNMAGLATSILASEFIIQKNAGVREGATGYFYITMCELEMIDFKEVDTVLIGHTLNDYHAGIVLDNPADPYDPWTYAGAMRTVTERLKKVNPDIRIVLVSPTYTWYVNEEKTCETYVINGHTLEDFVEREKELAAELDLEMIDLYHDFYPHEVWADWCRYSSDGLHPNEAGREMIAERIAEYLEEY